MNKPLTVKELKKACLEQIKKGNGDRVIMISDDDEGNGYHYLWYSFITVEDYEKQFKEYGLPDEFEFVDYRIAGKISTIILG